MALECVGYALFPLKYDNCHELWELNKMIYSKIDVDYVVSTKYMRDLFEESPLTTGKRIHTIPFGINTNEFYRKHTQAEAKKHYHIPNDHVVIFHRAQFFSKGTEYVIEALKELQTDQQLTIITCSEKGRLNNLKNKFNIIDLGEIDSKELAYAYNACDIFLSPSIGESFCMMAVEAMSCAKPVIIFDNTALPTVTFAPKCGVLAKDRNSHDLMKKIKWMVEDKQERNRRGKLARQLACENYSLDAYHKRILNLYEITAKRKKTPANIKESLNKKPANTASVKALKHQLNQLTQSIAPKHSQLYKRLFYNISEVSSTPPTHIKYGEEDTALLINQYNNSLFHEVHSLNIRSFYSSYHAKLFHKIKTFLFV